MEPKNFWGRICNFILNNINFTISRQKFPLEYNNFKHDFKKSLASLCRIFALEKPLASSRYTTRRIRYFCSEWGILIFDSHAHKWSKCWDTDTLPSERLKNHFPWRSKATKDFLSLHYRLLVLSQNGMKYFMKYHSYFKPKLDKSNEFVYICPIS